MDSLIDGQFAASSTFRWRHTPNPLHAALRTNMDTMTATFRERRAHGSKMVTLVSNRDTGVSPAYSRTQV